MRETNRSVQEKWHPGSFVYIKDTRQGTIDRCKSDAEKWTLRMLWHEAGVMMESGKQFYPERMVK